MGKIGIIGGSGLYDIQELDEKRWVEVKTPYGKPSDELLRANFAGKEIVFLPRHARGHKISPTAINYRANIYAMKSLGVEKIISVTACGSLKKELKPLDFVIPNQFIDRTNQARKCTFFDEGVVAHVSLAHPVCEDLAKVLYEAAKKAGVNVHLGATYITIEGPGFSTLAESNLYRSWGIDIVGMTNMTEARLAREAEICYATLAAVTDYDCWHEDEETVTVDIILDNLRKNITNAKNILKIVLSNLSGERKCSCQDALKYAIATNRKLIPQETKDKLDIIINKYIK